MNDVKQFENRNSRMIKKMSNDKSLNNLSKKLISESSKYEYWNITLSYDSMGCRN